MGIRRLGKQLAQALLTLALLSLALSACQNSRLEPFAPELKKRYVTTEALVITQSRVPPPIGIFLGNEGRETTEVMTHELFELSNRTYERPYYRRYYPELLLPYEGEVAKGSFVRVKQMFTYSNPTGSVRYAKVDITDPKTGDTLSAYVAWNLIDSAIEEVE